jgi:segregation and condensation protein B
VQSLIFEPAPAPEETAAAINSAAGDSNTAPSAVERSGLSLAALVESLLFTAEEPLAVGRLAQVLEVSADSVEETLTALAESLNERGLRLQRKADRLQLISAPAAAPFIERLLGLDLSTRLSPAALEALAVIAYRQPLTRGDIEAIRGVNCDGVLRTLIARGLVEPVGRLEQAGRPFTYGTTFQFLQYFGLENLAALPPLPEDVASQNAGTPAAAAPTAATAPDASTSASVIDP